MAEKWTKLSIEGTRLKISTRTLIFRGRNISGKPKKKSKIEIQISQHFVKFWPDPTGYIYIYIYIYIRHSASCEGVFSYPGLPCQGMFSVSLRDPRIPAQAFPGVSGSLFFQCFFGDVLGVAFLSVLWPTWPQHGSNLRPKRPPKSRKIYKKRDHILYVIFD